VYVITVTMTTTRRDTEEVFEEISYKKWPAGDAVIATASAELYFGVERFGHHYKTSKHQKMEER